MLFAAALAVKVVLAAQPAISGNCNPTRVHFTGTISNDAPGPVRYTWVRSDKPSSNTLTIDFAKPGESEVTYDWLLRSASEGWVVLQVISPAKTRSEKVRFAVSCRK
jgi:hypothetical protein